MEQWHFSPESPRDEGHVGEIMTLKGSRKQIVLRGMETGDVRVNLAFCVS